MYDSVRYELKAINVTFISGKSRNVSNAIFKNSNVDTRIKQARPSLIERLIDIMAAPVEPAMDDSINIKF